MPKNKFSKMLDFELRAVLYGNDSDPTKPFVDLRRKSDFYTVNAIHQGYEFELAIGKRWFKKQVPDYIIASLAGLHKMRKQAEKDSGYKEKITRNNNSWGWFGQ